MNNPKLTSEQINFIASIINEHDPNVVKDQPETDEFGELTGLHLDSPKSTTPKPKAKTSEDPDPRGLVPGSTSLNVPGKGLRLRDPLEPQIRELMKKHKTTHEVAKDILLTAMGKGKGHTVEGPTDISPINPPYGLDRKMTH